MSQYLLVITESQLFMYYVPIKHHFLNFSLNGDYIFMIYISQIIHGMITKYIADIKQLIPNGIWNFLIFVLLFAHTLYPAAVSPPILHSAQSFILSPLSPRLMSPISLEKQTKKQIKAGFQGISPKD